MKKIIVFSLMVLTGIFGATSQVMADHHMEHDAVVKPEKTAATLNRLIEINLDGQKGFEEAAEKAASASLKAHFIAKSAERADFAAKLKGKVTEIGQEAEQTGSVAEAARRAWLDVKVSVTENDDKAVLEVVKSQQAKAVAEYRRALRKVLTDDVRNLVSSQDEKIQDCYDWITDQLNEEVIDEKKKNN